MSEWRKRFKVHPAADLFPMMSEEELLELGEDIKRHGLKKRIVFLEGESGELELLDGRNRLEAMERAGIELDAKHWIPIKPSDPVAYVISANVHRRHLTKAQRATLIVAEALRHAGEMPPRHVKGKAGSAPDPLKAEAVAIAAKEGISKRSVERAIAEARKPEPEPHERASRHNNAPQRLKAKARRQEIKEHLAENLIAARALYARFVEADGVNIDAEIKTVTDLLRDIERRRFRGAA